MTDENTEVDLLEDGAEFPEESDLAEPEKQEEKPATRGYMSKEAWIDSGKDPEKWVSEEEFKATGERIKLQNKIRNEIKGDFDNQLKNLNLLHQVQLKKQREDLMSRRDEFIDTADRAGVNNIDKQLKELDDLEQLAKDQPAQAQKPPEVIDWEASNQWINDAKDPRTAIAQKTFIAAVNAGIEVSEALDLVDSALAKKFSTKSSAPRQIAESARSSPGKRDDSVVSMKTVTREERIAWDEGFFKTEKEFLQAVSNSRKGTK